MAEVEVRAAGVASQFDGQRLILLEGKFKFPREVFFGNDLGASAPNDVDLFVDRGEQLYQLSPG